MLGMDLMIKNMMRSMGIEPEQIVEQVKNIGETIVAFKEQMDRIERNQVAIMKHLNIPLEVEILEPKKEI